MGTEKMRAIYRGVGSLAYPPELLLKMILFEYLQGRTSPAQWFRDAGEHDGMKWLGRGVQPSRTAWYNFGDRLAKTVHELHNDMIRQAVQEDLIRPTEAAQDGTTFRSNASRHRAVNQETLDKRLGIIQEATQADQQQQALPQAPPKWVPPTVAGREELQQRMVIAKETLDERLAENAKKPPSSRRAEKHIVVSLTDPVAPFGKDKEKTYCFLYTTQFMVDSDSLMVLDYSVAAENTDAGTLAPMIDSVQNLIGGTLQRVSADAAYASLLDLQDCQQRNIDLLAAVQENSFTARKRSEKEPALIHRDEFRWLEDEQIFACPQGHKLKYDSREIKSRHGGRQVLQLRYRCPPACCISCPLAGRCVKDATKGRTVKRLEGQELIDAQREKMKQEDVKAAYRKRSQTIERAFADAKSHRSFGKFHGRGPRRAEAQVGLLVMAQNILALHRLRAIANDPEKQAA
jgi:transposase